FGGQGLNTSAMAGDIIARALVEGDDSWRHFMPFELVWAGGRAGRAVVSATTWWGHQSEAVIRLTAQWRGGRRRKRLREETGPAGSGSRPAYREVKAGKKVPRGPRTIHERDRPIGAPEATPTTALALVRRAGDALRGGREKLLT